MKTTEETIQSIGKVLLLRLADIYPTNIRFNHNDVNKIISRQYNAYKKRFDKRIYFGLEDDYLETNYLDYISLIIIRVIAILSDDIKKQEKRISLLNLKKILNECLEKTNVPDWLQNKLLDYLPPLLMKEVSISKSKSESKEGLNQYYIYLKEGKIVECDKDGLVNFYNEFQIDKYDLFIENTDTQKIHVYNNPNTFRAGRYHPFSILCLLLQRIGKVVSYNEIYHLAIKPIEKVPPRDRSKKVYDYLKHIINSIEKIKGKEKSFEKWFSREHKKGLIRVNSNINACLVISLENVAS